MINIVTAFAIIFVVIAVGYVLDRLGIIRGAQDLGVMNRIAFYAAVPALVFSEIAQTEAGDVFSPVVGVTFLTTVATGALYCLVAWLLLRQPIPEMAAGAGSALYVNSVNIGLPVMAYVLGHATYMAPIMLMQTAIFTPFILAGLAAGSGASVTQVLKRSLFSPVVLAALAGMAVSFAPWQLPEPVLAPLTILGGAAIPLVLMSFGASLATTKVLQSDRVPTLLASTIGLVVMPGLGWALSTVFGLSLEETYAVVILAALPTAQNMYNFAATYDRGTTIARDTVFLTTFAALPVMLVIALLFGQ